MQTEYYEVFHSWPESDEYAWMESEGLLCRIGRFQPSGTLGVHILWPIGDGCCTFMNGDTTEMDACWMALSNDGIFAGVWTPMDVESPGYIHLYVLDDDRRSVKRRLLYQTTPEWFPYGEFFWSRDGWLYLEGRVENHDRVVYHKVR